MEPCNSGSDIFEGSNAFAAMAMEKMDTLQLFPAISATIYTAHASIKNQASISSSNITGSPGALKESRRSYAYRHHGIHVCKWLTRSIPFSAHPFEMDYHDQRRNLPGKTSLQKKMLVVSSTLDGSCLVPHAQCATDIPYNCLEHINICDENRQRPT